MFIIALEEERAGRKAKYFLVLFSGNQETIPRYSLEPGVQQV